jgi:hypothetical protein
VRGHNEPWTQTLTVLLYLLPAFSSFLDCAFIFVSPWRRSGCRFVFLPSVPLSFKLLVLCLSSQPGAESTVFHSGVKDLDSNALLSCAWIISVELFLYPARNSLLGIYPLSLPIEPFLFLCALVFDLASWILCISAPELLMNKPSMSCNAFSS